MEQFLRDQIWVFVGAVVAAIAIIVAVFLYFMGRRRKFLHYDVLSTTPLLRENELGDGHRLQVLFDGEAITHPCLVLIKLFNSGNVPIAKTDYETPLRVCFGETAQVLTVEVSDTYPPGLEPSLTHSRSEIAIGPLLLNQGDSISIKTLIGQLNPNPEIHGRILGVKNIRRAPERRLRSLLTVGGGMTLSLAGFFLYANSLPRPASSTPEPGSWYLLAVFLGYFVAIVGILSDRRMRSIMGRFFKK
jgi:hypothetical protein